MSVGVPPRILNPGHLTDKKITPSNHWIRGCMYPTAGMDVVGQSVFPLPGIKPHRPTHIVVTMLTELCRVPYREEEGK
jgi:hypothetical protein